MTGINIAKIDSQLDNAIAVAVKIIICPRYPGCLIFLYNPVFISL